MLLSIGWSWATLLRHRSCSIRTLVDVRASSWLELSVRQLLPQRFIKLFALFLLSLDLDVSSATLDLLGGLGLRSRSLHVGNWIPEGGWLLSILATLRFDWTLIQIKVVLFCFLIWLNLFRILLVFRWRLRIIFLGHRLLVGLLLLLWILLSIHIDVVVWLTSVNDVFQAADIRRNFRFFRRLWNIENAIFV